jgi:hypothetical protein
MGMAVTGQNQIPQPTKRKHKMKAKTKLMAAVLTWIAQGKTNFEIGVILSACTGRSASTSNAS